MNADNEYGVGEVSADTQYFGWITKVQEHSGRGVCEAPTGLNQSLPWDWLILKITDRTIQYNLTCSLEPSRGRYEEARTGFRPGSSRRRRALRVITEIHQLWAAEDVHTQLEVQLIATITRSLFPAAEHDRFKSEEKKDSTSSTQTSSTPTLQILIGWRELIKTII